MDEKTNREPIAIAMYESWARSQANQFKTFQLDWFSQTPEVRKKWRAQADDMIRESHLGDWYD